MKQCNRCKYDYPIDHYIADDGKERKWCISCRKAHREYIQARRVGGAKKTYSRKHSAWNEVCLRCSKPRCYETAKDCPITVARRLDLLPRQALNGKGRVCGVLPEAAMTLDDTLFVAAQRAVNGRARKLQGGVQKPSRRQE